MVCEKMRLLSRNQWARRICLLAVFEAFMFLIRFNLRGVHHARFARIHDVSTSQIIMIGLSTMVWRRLMQLVSKEMTVIRDLAKICLVIFITSSHSVWLFFYFYLPDESWLSMFCFICLAFYVHLAVFLLLSILFERIVDFLFPHVTSAVLKSRIFHTLIAIVAATLLVTSGLSVTRSSPTVQSRDIYIQGLSPKFDGFSIVLITDVHIGPTVGKNRVDQIVRLANDLNPDIVALVGDLVDGFKKFLGPRALPLAKLKPKYGTFAVTGNHEYMYDEIENWMHYFRELNLTVLRNENRIIRKNRSTDLETDAICVAGVDDIYTERLFVEGHLMDAKKALETCPDSIPTILLAHQPNAVKKILTTTNKKIALTLSGHTHGGQWYILRPIVWLGAAYLHGLYVHPLTGTQVYVSSGVNYWGPPIKMLNLCEVVLLRLHPAKPAKV